jgi:hypothetical protein
MANLKDTTVKYVNKDFGGFKRDLMRYAQAHFSGSYQDYNEASPGMMMLELQAYIGDVLSYYMDQQFLEIKQSTARQLENIEDFAKMRGYKPKGLRAATVPLHFIIEVPASASTDGKYLPDSSYLPILQAGTQAVGVGTTFETLDDLDFGTSTVDNPQLVVVSQTGSDGNPTYFAVRRWVSATAGTTTTEDIVVGDFSPWLRLPLGQLDVQEVLSVYDGEGQPWYEVDYLAQNTVLSSEVNTTDDSGTVPYVLKLVSASRRFMVDRSVANSATYLQFGPGDGLKFDDEMIPNIANLALPLQGRQQFTNYVLDPQNFLKTRTLGLSPYNTTLTVRYRIGGGANTNVPAQTINKVQSAKFAFKKTVGNVNQGALDANVAQKIQSSIEVINLENSIGGGAAETAAEIKANADSYFAAQGRAVTREDFVTQVLSMPSKFGRPEKVYVKNSPNNSLGVDLHLLALDPDSHFIPPTPTLRSNVKNYLSGIRMLTDGITILNSYIIDLGVNFGVVISPKVNRNEVLSNCLIALKSYFDNGNMQIAMPIVISDVEAQLQNVAGVIGVYKLDFVLKYGAPYREDVYFDVEASTKNRIIYCPEDSIFEVRFPDNDIVGESK